MMYRQKSILAMVAARGGSKGLPGKNIKPLCGKPLIGWTVEALKNSPHIDRILVNSDDRAIMDAAVKYGAEGPYVRPIELAGDLSVQEDAIIHAMEWVEKNWKKFDYVLVVSPTNPLRDEKEISESIEYLLNNPKAKSIYSVMECSHSPIHSNTLPADGSLKDFIRPEYRLKNRQELPTFYRLSGSICMSDWDEFKKEKTFLGPNSFAFKTTQTNGLDIDHLPDFLMAEIFMKERLSKKV